MKKIAKKISGKGREKLDARFPKGSFGRKVFVMLSGTVAGQAISVVLAPVLTRIFTPEEFGTLGSFSALIMILSVIAMLRYEMALPLTKTKSEENNLVVLCFIVLTCMTVILTTALSVLWTQESWGILFAFPYEYRWLLPIGFFAVSAYQIMVYLATKREDFKTIAQTKLYQGAAGPLTQISLGLTGVGVWGLIVGFVVGQSTGISVLLSKLMGGDNNWREGVSCKNMKEVGLRFRNFPLQSTWGALIGMLSSKNILLFILPVLYSPLIAGFVFITDRVIARPLMLLTTSIMQVYIGDVAKSLQSDPAHIKSRFLRLSVQQVVVVGGWLFIVNIAAPFVFPFAFGSEWAEAVPYLHVLSISYFAQMVLMPLFHSLQALEMHGRVLAWQIFHAALVIFSFVVSYIFEVDAIYGLLFYSIAKLVAYIVLYILIYYSICGLKVDKMQEMDG